MSRPKEVVRLYTMADSDMMQVSEKTREAFIEDNADFQAFDPDFKDPYAANWQSEIDAAKSVPTDNVIVDTMTILTTATENAMELCRNKFQSMKFFIEKAFPNKTSIWNEFGYNDYDRSRTSHPLMISFMRDLYAVAQKYSAELIAKNFTQAMIDEIGTLLNQLNSSDTAQEAYKGTREVLTQNRIILLNQVWTTTVTVCRAGKLIYMNNYAKYQRYVLPGDPTTPDEEPPPPPPDQPPPTP
ncbi:MAG: hypothetical protein HY960_01770 [Ignavibacteriae bacterium]|nr:hypothetical protein [Ignavibacteriota bacterium]